MPVPNSAIVQMMMPRTPIVLGSWPRLDPPMRPAGNASSTVVNLRLLAAGETLAAVVAVISAQVLRRARSPRSGAGR